MVNIFRIAPRSKPSKLKSFRVQNAACMRVIFFHSSWMCQRTFSSQLGIIIIIVIVVCSSPTALSGRTDVGNKVQTTPNCSWRWHDACNGTVSVYIWNDVKTPYQSRFSYYALCADRQSWERRVRVQTQSIQVHEKKFFKQLRWNENM